MSTSFSLLAASALFATAATFALVPQNSYAAAPVAASAAKAPVAKARTAQQQRMVDCNHEAKASGKKGPERRAFMSSCLKGSKTAATSSPQKAKAKAAPVASAEG